MKRQAWNLHVQDIEKRIFKSSLFFDSSWGIFFLAVFPRTSAYHRGEGKKANGLDVAGIFMLPQHFPPSSLHFALMDYFFHSPLFASFILFFLPLYLLHLHVKQGNMFLLKVYCVKYLIVSLIPGLSNEFMHWVGWRLTKQLRYTHNSTVH